MIHPDASARTEQPLALPCDATMLRETVSLTENLSFLQIRRPRALGPGRYTLTMLRQQLAEEWRGYFYTALEPDPNSESDSYDPTREWFNVMDGAMALEDDTTDDNDNNTTAATPAAGGDLWTPR